MKVLLKVLFESEQEYLDYMKKQLPAEALPVQITGNVHTDILLPAPAPGAGTQPGQAPSDEQPDPIPCQYKHCTNTFIPKRSDSQYCSNVCAAKAYRDNQQDKKLAEIKANSPKRGRKPRITRILES